MTRTHKKWSPEEDSRLVRQVRAFPQNLNKCFMIVGEELGRSTTAVANRWYGTVSKDPKNAAMALITPVSKSFNRKNSKGVPCTRSLFRRILKLLNF